MRSESGLPSTGSGDESTGSGDESTGSGDESTGSGDESVPEPVEGKTPDQVARTIVDTVAGLGLEWHQRDRIVSVTLPGTHKLKTECALSVGEHTVEVRAFVARNPDENHAAVYRWLLEHNLKTYVVAFSVDRHGDIHLMGRIGLDAVTPEEVDRILGVVADTADRSFNTILELGFAESIRREWQWRLSRGESTANLRAFRHLAPDRPSGD